MNEQNEIFEFLKTIADGVETLKQQVKELQVAEKVRSDKELVQGMSKHRPEQYKYKY